MFTLGTLKVWLIAAGVSVLLFLGVWFYRKLKTIWYDKGVNDERKICDKQLIKMHNVITGYGMPAGVHESDKTWSLPSDKPSSNVESKDADAGGSRLEGS